MRSDRYKQTEASEPVNLGEPAANEARSDSAARTLTSLPDTQDIREAYEKVSYADKLKKSIISTTNILIVVAAVAILVAMLFLPVLRIYGNSMNATLNSGELVGSRARASRPATSSLSTITTTSWSRESSRTRATGWTSISTATSSLISSR